jgi:hypothetical protein
MKKIFYLTAITIALLSCKKSNTTTGVKWQLTRTSGGIADITIIPPTDSVTILLLNNDSTYQNTLNGKLIVKGIYHLDMVQSIFSSTLVPAIQFVPNGSTGLPPDFGFVRNPQLLTLTDSTLELDDNVADGFDYLYKRVSP